MAHFAKMVDMSKSPADVKKDIKEMAMPALAPDVSVPVYPYGLCINLTEEELDKLDLDGGCSVGDMIHLCAIAKVTSCSESETETADGSKKKRCRIELQITHLATENEDDETAPMPSEMRAKKRYGAAEAEAEAA